MANKYKGSNNSDVALGVIEAPALSNNNNKFVEVRVSDGPTELMDNRNKSVLKKALLEYDDITVTVEGGKSRKLLSEIMKIMELAIC